MSQQQPQVQPQTVYCGQPIASGPHSDNIVYVQGDVVPGIVITGAPIQNDIGVCRGCGVQFVRPPGTHDGSAQFYRCSRCDKPTLESFCVIQ